MRNQLRSALIAALAVVGMGLVTGAAHAASTDTITISVTPNAQYGVTISSPYASGYNFGTVNLNATTVSTMPITLTNSGSIMEYFGISVSNTSGGWVASASAPSTDTFRMSGLLGTASQPAQGSGNFSALTNQAPTNAAALYGQGSTKTGNLGGANTAKLWLQLEMPYTLNTGGTGAQTMTISVTGQGS